MNKPKEEIVLSYFWVKDHAMPIRVLTLSLGIRIIMFDIWCIGVFMEFVSIRSLLVFIEMCLNFNKAVWVTHKVSF